MTRAEIFQALTPLFAIVGITLITIVALCETRSIEFILTCVGAIAGLGGYQINTLRKNNKANQSSQ